jgi:hypothetical protein
MEKRLSKKVNDYIHAFKTSIVNKLKTIPVCDDSRMDKVDLVTYVYEYDKFEFNKEDFLKRKRVKNMVPVYERCCAKRATGEQCTRRKKDDCLYCGTHSKGTPHGIISDKMSGQVLTKIEVCAVDIKGIVYYVDNNYNVYDPEDIVTNRNNPRVIAKYEKHGDVYTIPDLFT